MYGSQATCQPHVITDWFEKDVNMYGSQAPFIPAEIMSWFEKDVNMYGSQATGWSGINTSGLRRM